MDQRSFLLLGRSNAFEHIQTHLLRHGCKILSGPGPAVRNLILPVPSFEPNGTLKGGSKLEYHLNALPHDITVFGGNLSHPALQGYRCVDLLQDPFYLAENAAITAHCAITHTLQDLPVILKDCPVLVLGWGRIGKCLAALLRQMGARVSVYARKSTDQALLSALGYAVWDLNPQSLYTFRVIYNTVPTMLLPEEYTKHCHFACLKIDLASEKGIAGDDVIWARGLPGKNAPESSGKLIAETVLRLMGQKE